MAVLVACAALSGCVSTEQKAAWNRIANVRIIASQQRVIVRRAGGELRVTRVSLLRGQHHVAFAVTLRNLTDHPVNDVPVSVGIRHGRTLRYLNGGLNLDYFSTHVASVPSRATTIWVYATRATRSVSGQPFAVAGSDAKRRVASAHELPKVSAQLAGQVKTAGTNLLRVRVTNASAIPQPELQLFAVAVSNGRVNAAGHTAVTTLGAGGTVVTGIPLIGHRGGTIQLEAMSTLFG